MLGDGTLEWRDGAGRLHREGGPARVRPNERDEWFRPGASTATTGLPRSIPTGGASGSGTR